VSFFSVTQAFDTSDSMGRLIHNILLTFAQFERELMSDRVRNKKAAMMRNGYFTGAPPRSDTWLIQVGASASMMTEDRWCAKSTRATWLARR
jgi:DNA invertase Pin-like site-specific DNA recombinase